MKSAILMTFCLILCTATASYGQEKTETKGEMKGKKEETMSKKSGTTKDCLVMKGGKMMVMKGGKSMAMESEMTMPNGSKVMPNGEVTMKNGKTMMMKEGQMMNLKGNLTPIKMGMKGGMMKSNMMKRDTTKKKDGMMK